MNEIVPNKLSYMEDLEKYFKKFRKNIIGNNYEFETPYGIKKIVYNDWLASGRLYAPIEKKISETFGPFVANTHTETNETGTLMTYSYRHAHDLLKKHVNAGPNDVIITAGFGMTAVINKLQRIIGLKGCGTIRNKKCLKEKEKPVVFVTHMEHHSNHTAWYETLADVVVLKPDKDLLIDLDELRNQLFKFKDRKFKIGSFTACSNVTGIITPYHEMAKIMHEYGGLCFIDFAASAPYVDINMHPEDPMEKLDAIFFSPHKFLGGPGSAGVLIFDSAMYNCDVPDNPGGGTVQWTNPWGEYKYIDDIEVREDGGTPGFLQAIRAALVIELKDQMGTEKIRIREEELVKIIFRELKKLPSIKILADNVEDRLGVISFYHDEIHYNLIVKLLSDRYGIQTRGGCVCAGTYGHFLLEVSNNMSKAITDKIAHGDLSEKPGWVRFSLHPTQTDDDVYYFVNALKEIIENHKKWRKDYLYDKTVNEFFHKEDKGLKKKKIENWFSF
ncbi:MAG: aminotransferase class V-fold PLP-dependent enzyme [Bacteroidales bacterium]|nr:aminotransferase class V-fold PLP-dependent enzyme [Bacteroidales bacterium]